jgi:GxxExxY protein
MHENEIGTAIVDCAVRLHQAVGPGLLETVYEVTLARELEKRGFRVERQVAVPIELPAPDRNEVGIPPEL